MATQVDMVKAAELGFAGVQGYRQSQGKDTAFGGWEKLSTNHQEFWLNMVDFLLNNEKASDAQIKEKAQEFNDKRELDKKIPDEEVSIFVAVVRSYLKV